MKKKGNQEKSQTQTIFSNTSPQWGGAEYKSHLKCKLAGFGKEGSPAYKTRPPRSKSLNPAADFGEILPNTILHDLEMYNKQRDW